MFEGDLKITAEMVTKLVICHHVYKNHNISSLMKPREINASHVSLCTINA